MFKKSILITGYADNNTRSSIYKKLFGIDEYDPNIPIKEYSNSDYNIVEEFGLNAYPFDREKFKEKCDEIRSSLKYIICIENLNPRPSSLVNNLNTLYEAFTFKELNQKLFYIFTVSSGENDLEKIRKEESLFTKLIKDSVFSEKELKIFIRNRVWLWDNNNIDKDLVAIFNRRYSTTFYGLVIIASLMVIVLLCYCIIPKHFISFLSPNMVYFISIIDSKLLPEPMQAKFSTSPLNEFQKINLEYFPCGYVDNKLNVFVENSSLRLEDIKSSKNIKKINSTVCLNCFWNQSLDIYEECKSNQIESYESLHSYCWSSVSLDKYGKIISFEMKSIVSVIKLDDNYICSNSNPFLTNLISLCNKDNCNDPRGLLNLSNNTYLPIEFSLVDFNRNGILNKLGNDNVFRKIKKERDSLEKDKEDFAKEKENLKKEKIEFEKEKNHFAKNKTDYEKRMSAIEKDNSELKKTVVKSINSYGERLDNFEKYFEKLIKSLLEKKKDLNERNDSKKEASWFCR